MIFSEEGQRLNLFQELSLQPRGAKAIGSAVDVVGGATVACLCSHLGAGAADPGEEPAVQREGLRNPYLDLVNARRETVRRGRDDHTVGAMNRRYSGWGGEI